MKNQSFRFLSLFGGLAALLLACNSGSRTNVERPYEAWVVRSVLDTRPRMLSAALHDSLWVAYNTQTGGLYKAWVGGINFDGPVYTTAHGPQPTSLGRAYLQEPDTNPWRIMADGAEVTPEIIYKGHSTLDNQLTLKYDLLFNGQRIQVEERPEYAGSQNNRTGFSRTFTTAGVPAGAQVFLAVQTMGAAGDDVKTDGTLQANGSEGAGLLLLNSNGQTAFTLRLPAQPAAVAADSPLAGEDAVLAIMAKSDCNTCHNRDVRTVGPAYIDIAKRYPNSPQKTEELVGKIIQGGAGNWGEIPMTAHPNLSTADATTMVNYILALDAKEENEAEAQALMPPPAFAITFSPVDPAQANPKAEKPGIAFNTYQFAEGVGNFPEITGEMLPVTSGVVNAIHFEDGDFGDRAENFAIQAFGFINLKKGTNVVFRIVSDDGSRLFIGGEEVVDNGGNHGMEARDGEMNLRAGKHPFRLEYFQGGGGKGLSLQWRPYGTKEFTVIPPDIFTYTGTDIRRTQAAPLAVDKRHLVPGDGSPLTAVHPAFDLAQVRPDDFKPKVGGMDFLSDGRLVISTWDSLGSVYVLEGVQGGNPTGIKATRIAYGLAEPLGLKVVDDEIYVLQKQELTKLIDHNKDGLIDEYQTVSNGWRVSANFHEFAFGLVYENGFFYGTLATAINPGGASTKPQIPDRGKVLKINRQDGSFEFIASGLRTPNGIGYGVDNELFVADNQGDWLPSSKIIHLQPGAWYGSRSVDFEGTAGLKETLPVVWLPQDEIGNSPSQPAVLNVGPYQNQMIHGEVTHGGIKRVFAEKVNGQYQGVVFRFTQGLEAGVNRLTWGPDGALYVGGVGSTGNWSHANKLHYGLQRMTFNGKVPFEMLAVRAKSNGVEIEFTQPLKEGLGTKVADYNVRQWYYQPTEDYGGPKLDDRALNIRSVNVSPDRKRVFLQLDGMKPRHLVYLRLNKQTLSSQSGEQLWTTEAWYTMNNIPTEAGLVTRR